MAERLFEAHAPSCVSPRSLGSAADRQLFNPQASLSSDLSRACAQLVEDAPKEPVLDAVGASGPAKPLSEAERLSSRGAPPGLVAVTLKEVQGQLQRLSNLVGCIAQQHEQEVARLAQSRDSERPEQPEQPGGVCILSRSSTVELVLDEPPLAGPLEPQSPPAVLLPGSEEIKELLTATADGSTGSEEIKELLTAMADGNIGEVKRLLRAGLDPNAQLGELRCCGLALSSCTPLVLSLMHQRPSVARLLLDAEADPQLEYSFLAGAEQVLWSGPVVHACIPSGDLSMLRELLSLRCDLHVSSSTGANLAWQAAYFGHAAVLEFLVEEGVDVECRGQSQDDTTLTLTPLHSAAKAGHAAAVRVLMDAGASILVENEHGGQPLEDAVTHAHSDVVRLLVASQADIFRQTRIRPSLGRSHTAAVFLEHEQAGLPKRCIDRVFESNNHLLLAAVAKGLSEAPELPDGFETADLVRFLSTPGDAAIQIWSAVFRKRPLRYWESRQAARSSSVKIRRVIKTAAVVNAELGMNVTLGPHADYLNSYFLRKASLPPHFTHFIRSLTRESGGFRRGLYAPATFSASQLPGLTESLQVILAIVDCGHPAVCGVPGCHAIVELKWKQERFGARFRLAMAFLEVANLALINLILNHEGSHLLMRTDNLLTLANALAIAVWIVVSVIEAAQFAGYVCHGLTKTYVLNFRHIFDTVVLLLTGAVVVWTWMGGLEIKRYSVYRMILGIVASLKWARLLISLRQLKSVGLRILPILTTMWDVGPFVAVLSVYMMGAVNMLFALGRHTLTESFLIIYRLVVLGDVRLEELEGSALMSFSPLGNGALAEDRPERSEFREFVRAMMVFVSFVLGVSMMNIFIAMLCVSYGEAASRAPLAFVHSRAGIVLDQYAARTGFRRLVQLLQELMHPRLLKGWKSRPAEISRTSNMDVSSTIFQVRTQGTSYVWFCLPREDG